MSSKFSLVVCVEISLPFLKLSHVSLSVGRILLMSSSVSGYVGCFHFLAVVHKAAMNIDV